MIKFEPFKIVISGNNRDDLLYELYLSEKRIKKIADETYGTAKTKYESKYPYPVGHSIEYYNALERKPSIGPKSEAFEKKVQDIVKEIARWKSGICLLDATKKLPEDLFILPLGERDKVMRDDADFTQCDADLDMISATGTSKEKVPPIKFAIREGKGCKPDTMYMADSSIFHELVHAVRPHKNKLLKIATKDKWDNLEEFFAVVTENIYRSEKCQNTLLRGGHDSSVLASALSTSEGFLKDKTLQKRAEIVFREEKIAQELAKLTFIKFNPFAIIGKSAKH